MNVDKREHSWIRNSQMFPPEVCGDQDRAEILIRLSNQRHEYKWLRTAAYRLNNGRQSLSNLEIIQNGVSFFF